MLWHQMVGLTKFFFFNKLCGYSIQSRSDNKSCSNPKVNIIFKHWLSHVVDDETGFSLASRTHKTEPPREVTQEGDLVPLDLFRSEIHIPLNFRKQNIIWSHLNNNGPQKRSPILFLGSLSNFLFVCFYLFIYLFRKTYIYQNRKKSGPVWLQKRAWFRNTVHIRTRSPHFLRKMSHKTKTLWIQFIVSCS